MLFLYLEGRKRRSLVLGNRNNSKWKAWRVETRGTVYHQISSLLFLNEAALLIARACFELDHDNDYAIFRGAHHTTILFMDSCVMAKVIRWYN